jgi:hypothetical protein
MQRIARIMRVEPNPPPAIFATNSESIISTFFLFAPDKRRCMLYHFVAKTAVSKVT